ncbi:hypothetical protein EFA69_07115 [Rufibacter immobilis]|uniref:Glycosyltransferase RgtA/B/C/D-like domain-containing protein n=1 Tax=Rufibacter immobilis TaxID=1348778 RepID=A0A3M9N0F0_9BACT|nr:hypothetical protein [Rufibacter immobilis]RNI30867.1 hypothetical protein EFA69_07115 [Rufibacter immobilis]
MMDLKDLLLTPIYLIMIYAIAYASRNKFTTPKTKKYFIPALTVKIFGAIALGLVYQFYYHGGDTFRFFIESEKIYNPLLDSPKIGIKLLLATGEFDPETYQYASTMRWYTAQNNQLIVKACAFFSLFCFRTYAVIAIIFASICFTGVWALYTTLLKIFPKYYNQLAVGVFFVPSAFFWASGIMKDTVCLAMLGWAFWAFYQGFVEKKNILLSILVLSLALFIIKVVKIYILLCFVPAAGLWIFMENSKRIKSKALRLIATPLLIAIGLVGGYFGSTYLTSDDDKYSVDNIAETAAVTSDYLDRRTDKIAGTGRRTGSSYNVGKLDGSTASMIAAAPQAIFVSLYRPFLFEVRNPVMLLSALESTWFLWITLMMIRKKGLTKIIQLITKTPLLTFCLVFSLMFALGVGLTSGNFGTLVRYKTPMLPFFVSMLLLLRAYSKIPKSKNSGRVLASKYQVRG